MNTLFILARHFCSTIFRQRIFLILWLLFMWLLAYAGYNGYQYITAQNKIQKQYQQAVRESWENNPDKHPHRMAHFGSFALRLKHPLTQFDPGMDPYAGNAVFLEAHRQNTVNYSEAGFSTGLLRMGELSVALLLQLILPLIIFFLGFSSIATDREQGTLKILGSQGVTPINLLAGRTLGLWLVSACFFIPALLLAGWLLWKQPATAPSASVAGRFLYICMAYGVFFWVISTISIIVSATSKTAKAALIKLLGTWLLLAIVLPKMVSVAGQTVFPAPDKMSFEAAIEKDILKQGDSHNPDDPYFKRIKDSVLKHYGVTRADSLPVNLGGIIGTAGEKLSTETYLKHQEDLTNRFRKQNGFARPFAWVNPFMMIRYNSMAFSGSDFETYVHFQQQAETYRYQLAQQMNKLQTQYISNIKPKEGSHAHVIDKKNWLEFADFKYQFLSLGAVYQNEWDMVAALLFWLVCSFLLTGIFARRFKIII